METHTEGTQTAERSFTLDAHSLHDRNIVVAMDDSAEARAAAHVAASLAYSFGARPVVMRAFYPGLDLIPSTLPTAQSVTRALEDERRKVKGMLADILPHAGEWPVFVVPGAPGTALATTARELRAAAILLGLRKRGALRRTLNPETALAVLREATVPVLAAPASMRGIPRRIVVGVDFGRAGLAAARAALSILFEGGTLVLAYVDTPHRVATEEYEGADVVHAHGVIGAFARLREEIHAPPGTRLETAIVEGTPATELSALADRVGAGAIAVGSRRHGFAERLLLGSVTAALVHEATHPLLIVPPRRE